MQYILIGFTHDNGCRVFSFDRLGDDRVRTRFTVRADLALVRAHGIQVQELPLLCRDLLDRSEGSEIHSFTFAEGAMRDYANERAVVRAAAVKKKKPWHRPVAENVRSPSGGAATVSAKTPPVFFFPEMYGR